MPARAPSGRPTSPRLLTVVVAVAVHEVSELLAVGNGVRAAQRPPRLAPAGAKA